MKNLLNILTLICMTVAVLGMASIDINAQLLLNEVEIDPPSTISEACEYVEVRGTPGSTIPANTYFISINSDGSGFGFINYAANFGGAVVGPNGTVTNTNLQQGVCPNRVYGPGTTLINNDAPISINGPDELSETYLLVQSTVPLSTGLDADTDDDGVIDASFGVTILDGFAFLVNPEETIPYGQEVGVVNISNRPGELDQPDAATRFPGNNTPFVASAFYYGELASSPDETTVYAPPFSNVFPAGGALTPGAPNVPGGPPPTPTPTPTPTPVPGPDLTISQTDAPDPVTINQPLTYTLAVNNIGNDNATGVAANFALPAGVTFVSATGTNGFMGVLSGSTINFTGGTVNAGGTATLTVIVTPTAVGTLTSTGTGVVVDPGNTITESNETNNTAVTVTTIVRGTPFDFDGDGRADESVFRPDTGELGRPDQGIFYVNGSTQGFFAFAWGITTDTITPGDFDGDGKTDFAIWRPGIEGFIAFYITPSSGSPDFRRFYQLGIATDTPLAGDWDGDGKDDPTLYRDGEQSVFYYHPSASPAVEFLGAPFGTSGDKPVLGDYDGDGRVDAAVFRPSEGIWYIQQSTAGFRAIQFGTATDRLVPADYDGDGRTDIAVYRNGTWYIQQSTAGFRTFQFGTAADIPAAADYDGDGKADTAVYRNGTWYIQQSTAGFRAFQFGAAADRPVPAAYVQ